LHYMEQAVFWAVHISEEIRELLDSLEADYHLKKRLTELYIQLTKSSVQNIGPNDEFQRA